MILKKDLLINLLENADFAVERSTNLTIHSSQIYKSDLANEIQTAYQSFEPVTNDMPQVHIPIETLYRNIIIELDDQYLYNRYRIPALKSPIYQKIPHLQVEKIKRYSKIYEKECIKSGLRAGIWTSAQAERYFGKPSEPGDFFGKGSPGWKFIVWREFLKDAFTCISKYKIIRFSIYDTLMIGGKLHQLGKLLESGHQNYEQAITGFLQRSLQSVST
ncbi:MAG: DUF7255 family protein [Candidatus Cyclobacteriaceae bacterium M3_2C_046]